jgi:nitrite reductase/ring-hydroxylating ferredoxin subunit
MAGRMLSDVGELSEFEHGKVYLRDAGDRQVGIVATPNGITAFRNICPHEGGPLCLGLVTPLLRGEPREDTSFELQVDHQRFVLSCPWHGWEFDVRTGEAILGGLTAKIYPVTVASGRVLVDLGV